MLGWDVDVDIIGIRGMIGVCCYRGVLVIAKVCNFGSAGVEYMVDPCVFGKVGYGLWNIPSRLGNC